MTHLAVDALVWDISSQKLVYDVLSMRQADAEHDGALASRVAVVMDDRVTDDLGTVDSILDIMLVIFTIRRASLCHVDRGWCENFEAR